MLSAKTQIKGNIGSIDAKFTDTGKMIVNFSVAVNIGWGDKKKTNWYKCIAWEKTGELINQLAEKGTQILLEGNQEIREWSDKEGVKHASVEITVRDFDILARGKKKDSDNPYDEAAPDVSDENIPLY